MIFPIRSTGVPRSLPPLQGAGLDFGKGREGLLSKPMPIWRLEKLRYMHRDPVKRGLVGEPEQWRWSSYRKRSNDGKSNTYPSAICKLCPAASACTLAVFVIVIVIS